MKGGKMKRLVILSLMILGAGLAQGDLNILMRTGTQFQITTAVDSLGRLYVAYVDSNSPSGSGIYFTYSTDGGRNFEPAQVIDVLDTCSWPSIAVANGVVYIAYQRSEGGDNNIYLVKGVPGAFGSPVPVANDTSLKEETPSIDIDSVGYVYVAYICSTATGKRHVFYKFSSDNGATFGSAIQLTTANNNHFSPTIRVLGGAGTSRLHAVFGDRTPDANVKYVLVTEAGSATPSVGAVMNVAATGYTELINPGGMDVSPRGDVYVAYNYTTDTTSGNYAVYFRRKAYNSPAFAGALTLLASSPQLHNPQVLADVENNPIVIWHQSNGTDFDIVLAYSITQGTSFSSARITLNSSTPATEQKNPSCAIYCDNKVRRIFVAWQDWRFASAPDIMGAYLIHFKNGYNPDVAVGGYPVGMGAVFGHYNLWGLPDSTDLNSHDTTFVWIDSLSKIVVDSVAGGSSSSQRWIWSPDSSWTIYVTSGGNIYNIYYYHQYLRDVVVYTMPGGTHLSATNGVAAWGTTFGVSDTVDWLYDGHPLSFWGDRGSHLYIAGLSRGSGTAQRWISNPAGTNSDIWVVSSGVDTFRYYHQYLCDIVLNFTDADHTVDSDGRQYFGAQNRPTGVYEGWIGWCDAGSHLSFQDTTTGSPAHWTTDVTDWDVTGPISAIVSYSRFTTGYNFLMTAISDTSIEIAWVDYPNEDYYLILNARDTTMVPGTDTIPRNHSSWVVNGLSPNTGYYWMMGGYRYPDFPLYYTSALLTYTLTPNPPDSGEIIDLGSNFALLSIPPFPNDVQALSAYVWDCVEGEAYGGVDTLFYDGTTTWLLRGLEPGHTYTYHIYYRNGDGILSARYATITFTTQEAYRHIVVSNMQRGWGMIGISIDPRPPFAISQFADDISPFYTTQSNSNIYYFDESRGMYKVPDTLRWGDGYFLFNWYGGTEVDMRGSSMYQDCIKNISYTPGLPYAGWAILGNPYMGDIRWENILYSHSTQRIDNTYYTWTRYGWAFYSPYFAGGTGPYIHPFMGFEVHARPGGGVVHMQYPLLPSGRRLKAVELPKPSWALKLSVSGDNGIMDAYNYIINAPEEIDGFNILEPPAWIGEYLQLYIDKGNKDGYLTACGVNLGEANETELVLWVESNSSRNVAMTWDGIEALPVDIDVLLEDVATGVKINLREEDLYEFQLDPRRFAQFDPANPPILGEGSRREFRLILRRNTLGAPLAKLPDALGICKVYPNPFNSEAKIVFALPQGEYVSLAVYNMLGEPIRILARKHYDKGVYEILFDGKDDFGNDLPTGLYFVRLYAENRVFTKKLLLMK